MSRKELSFLLYRAALGGAVFLWYRALPAVQLLDTVLNRVFPRTPHGSLILMGVFLWYRALLVVQLLDTVLNRVS